MELPACKARHRLVAVVVPIGRIVIIGPTLNVHTRCWTPIAATERHHFEVGMGAALKSINSEKPPTAEECAKFAAAEAAWNIANRKLADYQANQ